MAQALAWLGSSIRWWCVEPVGDPVPAAIGVGKDPAPETAGDGLGEGLGDGDGEQGIEDTAQVVVHRGEGDASAGA